jgi:hypothetical protein
MPGNDGRECGAGVMHPFDEMSFSFADRISERKPDSTFPGNALFAGRISGRKTGLHFSWKCSISRRDPLLFNLILTADEPDGG